jgi:hypothetical protein
MAIDLDACSVFMKASFVLKQAAGFETISSSCVIIWDKMRWSCFSGMKNQELFHAEFLMWLLHHVVW